MPTEAYIAATNGRVDEIVLRRLDNGATELCRFSCHGHASTEGWEDSEARQLPVPLNQWSDFPEDLGLAPISDDEVRRVYDMLPNVQTLMTNPLVTFLAVAHSRLTDELCIVCGVLTTKYWTLGQRRPENVTVAQR